MRPTACHCGNLPAAISSVKALIARYVQPLTCFCQDLPGPPMRVSSVAAIEDAVYLRVAGFAFWTGLRPPTDREKRITGRIE
jgi:hypothetical protein